MKKKILKYGLVVLAVALVLGGMFWMKDHYYRCAQRSEALGRYELAAQEYEQAGRYKDAEEKMAEMTELAEITRTALLKLIQIPEFDETHTVDFHYKDLDKGLKLIVDYNPGNGWADSEFQWGGAMAPKNTDLDIISCGIVSFDPYTGKYLLVWLSARGYIPLEGNPDGEIIAWGILNDAGKLTLDTKDGTQLLLEPVGYENSTTREKRKIEN